MSNYTVFAKHLLTESGWRDNCVVGIKDGVIEFIKEGNCGDYSAHYLSMGLIDNHIHGGDGFYINDNDEKALEEWLNKLAKSGVCAVMPAPYGSIEDLRKILKTVKTVMEKQAKGEATGALLLGVHLEGSFISLDNPGSFEEKDVLSPEPETFDAIFSGYEDVVKEATVAPEIPGADKLIDYLKKSNVKILAGHTLCDYDTALKAFKNGVGAICHTFNCTPSIHHRNVGILNAALTEDDIYCEMIGDLKHLHPSVVKLLVRAKQGTHVLLISDAVRTANLPDGIYPDGDTKIVVSGGLSKVYGTDTIAGANCYISKSVKNLVETGIPLEVALNTAGRNVANWLELKEYDMKIGKKALFTAWNEDVEPVFTVIKDKIYMTDNN